MTALDDAFFAFLLADGINKPKFVQRDLRDQVIQRALIRLFGISCHVCLKTLGVSELRVAVVLNMTLDRQKDLR